MPTKTEISAIMDTANVSRETIERLICFENVLTKWNPAINLISKSTTSAIWSRHFLDSAQLWQFLPEGAARWLDLGSGGGFPGLVIAAIAHDQSPDLHVSLVESDARKATFLRQVSVEMGISPEIHTERVEVLPPQKADVISARALAPLNKLMSFAERHATKNSICLFSKGETAEIELTEAQKHWIFDVQKTPSITDSSGAILQIRGIKRV